jgi:type II secretory pathway component PulC
MMKMDEMMQPLIDTSWGKRLSPIILLFFILCIMFSFFRMILQWQDDLHLIHQQPKTMVLLHHKEDVQPILAIPEEHLFGEGLTSARLPITSLGVRLLGVIETGEPHESTVIIAEGDHIGKVYHVGDSLLSNIKIHSIVSDGVILENAGHLEKLPLTRSFLSFQGMPKSLI